MTTDGSAAAAALGGVVLAGGTGERLGGVEKAGTRLAGRPLLAHCLEALAGVEGIGPVVVVGAPVTDVDARYVREDPPGGGPAAGLLAGLAALDGVDRVLLLAVDMPRVTSATLTRLLAAAVGHDGAALLGSGGRRQLAMALDAGRVRAAAPPGPADGLPVHRLLADLDLAEVPAVADEGADVDTWRDLDALARVPVTAVVEDDWERWAALRIAALTEAPQAFGARLADHVGRDEAQWRARLSTPDAGFVVAARGVEDAGMAAVQRDDAGLWWLISVWVVPEHRGLGVADALVAAVAAHVRRAGGATVHLHVRAGNDRARATFERVGFRPTGEVDSPDEAPERRQLVMARSV